jgi:hypothetical protein
MTVPSPYNKNARLEALCQYRLLDRIPERAAQDLTVLASFICGVPLALLTPEGFVSGVLNTLDPQLLSLTPERQAVLALLVRQVAAHLELQRIAAALAEDAAHDQTLPRIVPICMYCKGIRDEQGSWRRLEEYLYAHTATALSHGICPECLQGHHPHLAAKQ